MSTPTLEIPSYTILRPLGQGAMARVYLAVQQSLAREVALKVLAPSLTHDPNAAKRFVREARIAANLHHPHIVAIYDVGEHAGTAYMAMEYQPGGSCAPPGFAPEDANAALRIVREIASALDYAHRHGVVHRDVKPENILRRPDGTCLLSDFGIARAVETGTALTREGAIVGTASYMSPEQWRGEQVAGGADLYSLGVVLYQLLTGEVPYGGSDLWAIGIAHMTAPIPRLPAPMSQFQVLVDALLAKNPEQRPQTGAEVVRAVDALLAGNTPTLDTSKVTAPPPEPKPRAPWRIGAIALAGVALVAVLAWALFFRAQNASPASAAQAVAAVPAMPTRSIAVLPFVDMSPAKDQEYFSDGLSETLLDILAQVPDLKVAARTSSFAFKGKSEDARAIGAALGVSNLLEGSVQKSGDTVRITAQLVKASDGSHLWSKHFDRKLADVFTIQDEIATEVVAALKIVFDQAETQHLTQKRTDNVDSYQEYLRGIALLPGRKVAGLREAAAHFERAIVLDPMFAKAYVGASDAYRLLELYGSTTDEQHARIRRYVDRALELAPQLGEAHASLAGILIATRDHDGAEREFRRAIELTPSYADVYRGYEGLLQDAGHYEQALDMARRAVVLDPLSPVLQLTLVVALDANGRTEEARTELAKIISEHPEFPVAYRRKAQTAASEGDLVGALRSMREYVARDPEGVGMALGRCFNLRDFGATPEAARCVAEMAQRAPTQKNVLQAQAQLAYDAGEIDAALGFLDRAGDAPPELRAALLLRLDRAPEAMNIYKESAPELLSEPVPKLTSAQAARALNVGAALLRTGAKAQGRALIERAMPSLAPRAGFVLGAPRWQEVLGHALLGRRDQAFAALERRVRDGDFVGLNELDADPLLAELRADPRYERAVAPARAKAAEQVRLAREAGLL